MSMYNPIQLTEVSISSFVKQITLKYEASVSVTYHAERDTHPSFYRKIVLIWGNWIKHEKILLIQGKRKAVDPYYGCEQESML